MFLRTIDDWFGLGPKSCWPNLIFVQSFSKLWLPSSVLRESSLQASSLPRTTRTGKLFPMTARIRMTEVRSPVCVLAHIARIIIASDSDGSAAPSSNLSSYMRVKRLAGLSGVSILHHEREAFLCLLP